MFERSDLPSVHCQQKIQQKFNPMFSPTLLQKKDRDLCRMVVLVLVCVHDCVQANVELSSDLFSKQSNLRT